MSEDEDPSVPHLRQLSEEVSRIARTLAQLSEAGAYDGHERRVGGSDRRVGDRRGRDERETRPDGPELPDVEVIRAMIRARRLRDQFFSGELFADPAWDMLLDLLLARLERRLVAISSLCIAAAVPPTTALRWIKRLTEEGILVRTADPRDGRRIFIDLSDEAASAMAAYLAAADDISLAMP